MRRESGFAYRTPLNRRQAYSLGARVVEVDVQLTQDGRLAVFHDDFLSDFTCIHTLTLDQLQQRLPFVPDLHQVLAVARHFNRKAGDKLDGIFIVELKASSPHCDPTDELEQPKCQRRCAVRRPIWRIR
jgi:glycerophosphoryl diester phosphodiesterase